MSPELQMKDPRHVHKYQLVVFVSASRDLFLVDYENVKQVNKGVAVRPLHLLIDRLN